MNAIKKYKDELAESMLSYTKKYERGLSNPKFVEAAAAYVYFAKSYFEFCYEYDINQWRKDHGEKLNLDRLEHLMRELKIAMTSLDKAYGSIDALVSSSSHKSGGSSLSDLMEHGQEVPNGLMAPRPTYFQIHRAKILAWTEKTPKDKIIHALETWLNVKGERAVVKMLHDMRHDAERLFDHVLSMNGHTNLTNRNINAMYELIIIQLYKYYIRHRDKYVPQTTEIRRVKIQHGKRNIYIKDAFINLHIKFKWCDFKNFHFMVRTFMDAIDRIDHTALVALCNSTDSMGVDMGQDIYTRRELKGRIMHITTEVQEDCECLDPFQAQSRLDFSAVDVRSIIELAHGFAALEDAAQQNLDKIRDVATTQIENTRLLMDELTILCGPSTAPCILRALPGIIHELHKNKENFTKSGKLNQQGEQLIKDIVFTKR